MGECDHLRELRSPSGPHSLLGGLPLEGFGVLARHHLQRAGDRGCSGGASDRHRARRELGSVEWLTLVHVPLSFQTQDASKAITSEPAIPDRIADSARRAAAETSCADPASSPPGISSLSNEPE